MPIAVIELAADKFVPTEVVDGGKLPFLIFLQSVSCKTWRSDPGSDEVGAKVRSRVLMLFGPGLRGQGTSGRSEKLHFSNQNDSCQVRVNLDCEENMDCFQLATWDVSLEHI